MNKVISIALVLYVSMHTGVEAAATCPTESPAIAAATSDPQSFTATGFTSSATDDVCTFDIATPGAAKYLMIYLESATIEAGDKLKVEDDGGTAVIVEMTGTNFAATGAVALADKAVTVTLTFAAAAAYASNTFTVRYWMLDSTPTACTTGSVTVLGATTTAGVINSLLPTGTTAATCEWYFFSIGKCITITPVFMDLGNGETLAVSDLSSTLAETAMSLGTGPFSTTIATSTSNIVKVKFVKSTTQGNGFQLSYVATANTCTASAGTSVMASVLLLAASLLGYTCQRYL